MMHNFLVAGILAFIFQVSFAQAAEPVKATDPSMCARFLILNQTQTEDLQKAYEDGLNFFSTYKFMLEEMGLVSEIEFLPRRDDPSNLKNKALIQSQLTFEELALIRQIIKHEFSNAGYSSFGLSEKIKIIFQKYKRGPIRNLNLLRLRREVYVRSQDIERVFKEKIKKMVGQNKEGRTLIYGNDGILRVTQLLSYDEANGMATIEVNRDGRQTLPIGNIYGRMPHSEIKKWGFLDAERWHYGKTSRNIYEVKWQKVTEQQTSLGPVTIIESNDFPKQDDRYVYSHIMSDPRTFSTELSFLRELGFAYDSRTKKQTIPSVEVINRNLDRTNMVPYRLIQVYDRKETPELVYARAMVKNLIVIGIEGMQAHDYSAHLSERIALPYEIFEIIKDRLSFWLSVYDHPQLKKNKGLRKLSELMLRKEIFNYDNLSLSGYLFGINFLKDDPPEVGNERVVLDDHVEDTVKKWDESAKSMARRVLNQFEVDGSFESDNLLYQEPGEYIDRAISVEVTKEETEIFRQLTSQASNRKVTSQMVSDLLGSQKFLQRFARPGHPLLQK